MMKKIAAIAATVLTALLVLAPSANAGTYTKIQTVSFFPYQADISIASTTESAAGTNCEFQFLKQVVFRVSAGEANVVGITIDYLRYKNLDGEVKWARNDYYIPKNYATGNVRESWTPGQRLTDPALLKGRYTVHFSNGDSQPQEVDGLQNVKSCN